MTSDEVYARIWNGQPHPHGGTYRINENRLRGNACPKCRGRLAVEPFVTGSGRWLGRMYVMKCLNCGNESQPYTVIGWHDRDDLSLSESLRMAVEARDNVTDFPQRPVLPAALVDRLRKR